MLLAMLLGKLPWLRGHAAGAARQSPRASRKTLAPRAAVVSVWAV